VVRGSFWVEVIIGNLEGTARRSVKALVDTGATLTVLPRWLAEELGIKPHAVSRVETGVGVVAMERGRAYVEIAGRGEVIPVLISDEIDKVLVGVTTLEVLELEVDPITGRLKEGALMLYTAEAR
jgi:clan AA aspartic protease